MVFTKTSRTRLHDAERYWLAKSCIRMSTIIAALVAIGCIAWASSPYNQFLSYNFYLIPWDFIPLGVSVLWNITNIAVLLSRKKPMHPGANVGMDLVLWLALIVTAVTATIAAVAELTWVTDTYGYGEAEWQMVLLPNGTYAEEFGYYTTNYNGTEVFVPENDSTPCPGYSSCAQLNQLNIQHHQLGVIEIVGCSFSYIVVLLHFALFVWACVDTHRRRSGKVDARAQKIAQAMIADLTARGLLPTSEMRQQEQPLLVNPANPGMASEAPVVLPSVASGHTFYHDGPPQIPLPQGIPMREPSPVREPSSSREPRLDSTDVISAAPMRYA